MKIHTGILPAIPATMAVLALGSVAPAVLADEFDEAHIFFDLNDTDGGLGIHALIDGEAWKKLKIHDPDGRDLLNIRVKGQLPDQGLSEIFFESDDPEEVTLTPEEFFDRFPEGDYQITGLTLEGERQVSTAEITHVMPAPPEIMVNDQEAAEDCDAELPVVGEGEPVTISWVSVTHSHPDLGGLPVVPIDVHNHEVVIEIDETPFKTSTILPPSATSFEVPEEILALGEEIKFEVLVRETGYNQTAVESCFSIED